MWMSATLPSVNAIALAIHRRGGLAATFELYSDGFGRHALAAAVASRAIERVRQGWYCLPHLDPGLKRAARVGGRLTCTSALALHGAWTVRDPILHVAVPSHTSRLRSRDDKRKRLAVHPRGVRVHWRDREVRGRLALPALECLEDALACLPVEHATAVADSCINRRLISPREWRATGGARVRTDFARVDGVCESGIETLWWMRMSQHRLPIRRQVVIDPVGRVDFIVGERLVVEVDGAEYHTDPAQFEEDRRRDARLSVLGFRVLRFSYNQVMYSWAEVESAVLAAVFRGDHSRA